MLKIPEATDPLDWRTTWRGSWIWGSAIISLGLLTWILWRASLHEVGRSLQSANYSLIALGIPVILVELIFRAGRWRILLLPLGSPSIVVSFSSMMLGYLGNNFLPMRGGEILRACALGWQTSISKSAILATIIVERIVDGVVMVLILSLLFHVFTVPNWLRLAATSGGVILFAAAVTLIIARGRPKRPVDAFRALLSRLPDQWQPKGISLIDNFLLGLTSFRSYKDTISFLLLTLMIWGAEALFYWLLMRAFGISLSILAIALVIAAGAVSTMIPASPGYIGTYEFVLVSVLTLLGVLLVPATAFAVGIHGLTWATVNVVGALSALQIGVNPGASYGRIIFRKT